MTWQQRFGGCRWRVTEEGIEVEGRGLMRTKGEPVTARRLRASWGSLIRSISATTNVPPAILMMTILTEGALKWVPDDPEFPDVGKFRYPLYREEPGYKDDRLTPHLVSVGPMHILLSNYRAILHAPSATREEAAELPNNLLAGAIFIAERSALHRFDPILVAAVYNAGGLYDASDPESKYHNPFHLRSWPGHLERAARWYGDARAVLAESPLPPFPPPIVPRADVA